MSDTNCKFCIRSGVTMNRCMVNLPYDENLPQGIIDNHCLRNSYCRCCGLLDLFEDGRPKGLPSGSKFGFGKGNFNSKKRFFKQQKKD